MKKSVAIFVFCMYAVLAYAADVSVVLSGLTGGDKATLCISSECYAKTLAIDANGTYVFRDVPPGNHFVKAEAVGYNVPEALMVVVAPDGSVNPPVALKVPVTKMSDNPDNWAFEWKEDGSPSGYTTTSDVAQPAQIEFLGKMIVPADVPSYGILDKTYHIVLANDQKPWTQEYAYRIVETLKTIPCSEWNNPPAVFSLTTDHLEDDIVVTQLGDGCQVLVSEDAFCYANPFLVTLDGVRGRLFSKRLHHALVNYYTDFGRDTNKVETILTERFGCRITGIDYETLTAPTTREDAGKFQNFKPSELVAIINMLEELPEGFHVTPNLKYLLRRVDGHKHPLYPEAAAVSWCIPEGYIEFMSSTFETGTNDFETQRLILHEKTHFLWAFSFSDEIKNDWTTLGGWYKDPNSASGWSTTKDVEFVTAYAHAKNPDEDMAESVAFYLKDPAMLQSRSTAKYEFIRDRIMHGVRYVTTVPDHLSFEVLNLYPDYDYPGKIKRVTVNVDGAPEEDKTVTMEIELNHIEGYQDEATRAFTRITNPGFIDQDGIGRQQFQDLWMYPVDGNPYVLRGSVTLSKYSQTGHWTAGDITIYDQVGNKRHEGRNDCVVDVYANNPLEDLMSPEYVPGSLEYELSDTEIEGRHAQNLKVKFKLEDNVGITTVMSRLYAESPGFNRGGTGVTDKYGTYDAATKTAEINYTIYDYFPTANYYLTFVSYYDAARTSKDTYFSDSPSHEPVKKIYITTPTPDTEHPEIDLNRMSVYAEPTHPEAPDGETKVTVNFYARDNISGLGPVHYKLLDPQGMYHSEWYYHRNFYTAFFDGDPAVWERYQIVHILPRGSAPGRWGLAEIKVSDKASNEYTYNFVETLIFEPDDDMSKYILFADMDDDDMLYLRLDSESGSHFGFNYRVIHEESGLEISGSSASAAGAQSQSARVRQNGDIAVDVSGMPAGQLVIIANILDADGKIETSKCTRVTKTTSAVVQAAEKCRIVINGRTVSVFSPAAGAIQVCTPGGMVRNVALRSGKTVFELSAPGFYIIGGRKYLVK